MRRSILIALPLSLLLALPAGAQVPPTLDKIKANGSIAIAYRESSIPFSYLGGEGQPVGFGWEICGKVVDQVRKTLGRPDLKVTTQAVTSQNRIPLLQNGTIDIECGSTTNNSERGKQVAFAINYFYTGTRLLVRAESPIKTFADLKGRKVVSTTGTTNYQVLRRLNAEQNLGFELMSAKDHAESALLVQQQRADAFGMDDILLYGLRARAQNPAELAVVGEAVQVEPYAIMLRRDDAPFERIVNRTLNELFQSGDIRRYYAKWFATKDLTVPMSQYLKEAFSVPNTHPAWP